MNRNRKKKTEKRRPAQSSACFLHHRWPSADAARYVFRVNFDKENDDLNKEDASHTNEAKPISLVVKNPAVFGKTVGELSGLMDHLDFVISRVWRNDNKQIEIASAGTILNEDDKIFVITTDQDAESVKTFIGEEIDMERKQWIRMESQFINRRILITKPELNGKKLGQLKLRKLYGINITRINRAGVDLVATYKRHGKAFRPRHGGSLLPR